MTRATTVGDRAAELDESRRVELELLLGLGPEGAELVLDPEGRRRDLHPWLLDCVAVQVSCLGHQDEIPRSWDWENVLTLLEPGEELVYVLDHVRGDGNQTGRAFTLWLAVRFPPRQALSANELDRRRKRSRMLVSQFQRQAFPGSDVRWVDPAELEPLLNFSTGGEHRCVGVSGLPSPRDLEDDRRESDRATATRNYQSLNDVAESLVDLRCDYRIAFVIERVASDSLRAQLGRLTEVRDAIYPYVRRTEQLGGSQGRNVSKSRSEASGTNRSSQRSQNHSASVSQQSEDGWLRRGWDLVKNLARPIRQHETGARTDGRTWTSGHSVTAGDSHTVTTDKTLGSSEERNWSDSAERLSSMLELADRSLERSINALHEAHGTGGYRWSAFVFADGKNADLISSALVGVLAGSRTKDSPLNRFGVHGAGADLFLGSSPILDLVEEAAPILPLARACDALLLPEAELPGVRLRRNVFFGRTFTPPDDGHQRVRLGPDSFSALTDPSDPASIEIPRSDLFRHMLVAGTTGSGKTTRVVEILNELEDDQLSVIVFETAKRTYRARFKRKGRPDPLVYSLGSSESYGRGSRFKPLRLNPFYFELGTSLKRHIAVLSDALAELMPTESMIGPLLRRAVEECYAERGWDIEKGRPAAGGAPAWPTVIDFAVRVRQIAAQLNYGPEVNANYRGALESRANLFLDATFQDIFGYGGNTPIDELFPTEHDAIVEVEDLPPSEVDVRAFVMTLLLSRLRSVQGTRGAILKARERRGGDATRASSSDAVTLQQLVAEHLRDRGDYEKEAWKQLFRDGHVLVNGRPVRDRSYVPISTDRVSVEGELIWPSPGDPSAELGALSGGEDAAAAPTDHASQVSLEERRWLVVVEEAHNVLDRQFEERRPADESNAGRTLLRAVVRLLQEGREMDIGLMVIDQSPTKLARDVISNTGTKIVLRLEDALEMEEIGRAMGLDEEAWEKFGFLQVGEALIKSSYMDLPTKSAGFSAEALSAGPTDVEPEGGGWSPSFAELAELWRPVLSGQGSALPDTWSEELVTAAGGDAHLALFAGLRTALIENGDSLRGHPASRLCELLSLAEVNMDDLQKDAEAVWSELVSRHYRDEFRGVVAALCATVEPSPAWKLAPYSVGAIEAAADILFKAGFGNLDDWRWLLSQIRRGRSRAQAAKMIARMAEEHSDGPFGESAVIAVLARRCFDHITLRPACVSPARLQALIGLSLSEMLLTSDAQTAEADRRDVQRLLDSIEARVVRVVAWDISEDFYHEANSFLFTMSRYP